MSLFNIINQQILMDRITALDNITKVNEELLSEGKKYAGFYNGFAKKLLRKFYIERKDNNIILSPFSILMLLAIAAESTSGITQEEIANVLSDSKEFKEISGLLLRFKKSMSNFVSNSVVYINRKIENTILSDYKDSWKIRKYHGDIIFSDNNSDELITWVKEHAKEVTSGIPYIDITEDKVGFINVAAFRATWDKPFEEKDVKVELFENADYESAPTPMLYGNGNFYIENEYFMGFTKDFVVLTSFYPSPRLALVELLPDTTAFAFMALLPKSGDKDFLDKAFNQIDFSKLFYNRVPAQVHIAMPEFKNVLSEEITDFCKDLGIGTIFTEKADFSSMTTVPIHAKFFYHTSIISINHFEDLKLNNSNRLTLSDNANPGCKELQEKEVILNRPFIYAVIHKKTGLPVFTGVINNAPKTIRVEFTERIQETENEVDDVLLSDIKDYATEYNTFTKAILTKLADENEQKNLLLSPLSIIMLLKIAAGSTDGATQNEITKVISERLSFEKARDLLSRLESVLSRNSAFSMANAVCISPKYKDIIRLRFLYNIHNLLYGEIFADSDVQNAVNSWVKEKTHGIIDKLDVSAISDTAALLTNGTAFKAGWPEEFKEKDIKERVFENTDRTKMIVPMLHGQEKGYVEGETFTGFVKHFKGSVYAFMALLPKEKGSSYLKKTLQEMDFAAAFSKQTVCVVNFAVPEFKYECEKDLTSLCTQLGIRRIFSDEEGLTRMIKQRLKVGAISHKAHIELDRRGKKVVMVTAMEPDCASCEDPAEIVKEVILDRPFIFAIMHIETGLPVFIGVLNNLNEFFKKEDDGPKGEETRNTEENEKNPDELKLGNAGISKFGEKVGISALFSTDTGSTRNSGRYSSYGRDGGSNRENK